MDARQIHIDGLNSAAGDAAVRDAMRDEAVEQAIDAVWRAYNYGQAKLFGDDPDKWIIGTTVWIPVVGPALSTGYAAYDWATDFDEGRQNAVNALKSMVPIIERWQTVLLEQAKTGVNAAGSPYTWKQWFDLGNTFITEINGIVDLGVQFSTFQAHITGARDRIDEWLKALGELPEKLLWWVPWVIGGVVVIGALVLYNTARPALRAASEEAEATVRAAGSYGRRRFT